MGQTNSCLTDKDRNPSNDNNIIDISMNSIIIENNKKVKSRGGGGGGATSTVTLSSQDAELSKSVDNRNRTILSSSSNEENSQFKSGGNDKITWDKFLPLEQEDEVTDGVGGHHDPFRAESKFSSEPLMVTNKNETITKTNTKTNTTTVKNKSSKKNKDNHKQYNHQKRVSFRWKKKAPQSSLNESFKNRIMTLRVDPLQKTMYYFVEDKSASRNKHDVGYNQKIGNRNNNFNSNNSNREKKNFHHNSIMNQAKTSSSYCGNNRPLALGYQDYQKEDTRKNSDTDKCNDNDNDNEDLQSIIEYTGAEQTITKLVTRDMLGVKRLVMKTVPNRSKKESSSTYIEPIFSCGTQIFAKRYLVKTNVSTDSGDNDTNYGGHHRLENMKGFPLSYIECSNSNLTKQQQQIQHDLTLSKTPYVSVQDVNPNKANIISNENLLELLESRKKIDSGYNSKKIPKESRTKSCFGAQKGIESRSSTVSTTACPSNNHSNITKGINTPLEKGALLSATVPNGIARKIYDEKAVSNTDVEPASEMVCVSSKHDIYVCDIGLTSSRCDFIADTSERCSKGSYNAYTYAKQTLGCREFDELAVVCEWPVMRAVVSIREHLERQKQKGRTSMTHTTQRGSQERAPPRFTTERHLVLDEREPHIVKYDISRRERQKLDMHTDKSEWTFLIALTDGGGDDYDGGGTYFECIDSTVHIERGHALIFPGKLRHRGQKIVRGKRFLLVGFLVEKRQNTLQDK